jgi:hypothetical protein
VAIVTERYASYVPSRWLLSSMQCLLSSVPPAQLQSLSALVLTDSHSVGPGKTGRVRGRKYARNACRGFYHPAAGRASAWVEIVVDNSLGGVPRPYRHRVPSFPETAAYARA